MRSGGGLKVNGERTRGEIRNPRVSELAHLVLCIVHIPERHKERRTQPGSLSVSRNCAVVKAAEF